MTSAVASATPMVPLPYRVQSIQQNIPDVYTLDLYPVSDSIGPWQPAQFAMVYLAGVGEVPISISSNPADEEHITLTIRAGGSVTKAGAELEKGDVVGIRGPFGTSWPTDEAIGNNLVIIAGGIGLAPLKSLVHSVSNRRSNFGDVTILYGAKQPGALLYRDELERWESEDNIVSQLIVDNGDDEWTGSVGLVTELVDAMDPPSDDTMAFVCGPDIMMRFVSEALVARGVAEKEIYLTMERNMKCAIGWCGHCQMGSLFMCYDGPVFALPRVRHLMTIEEV